MEILNALDNKKIFDSYTQICREVFLKKFFKILTKYLIIYYSIKIQSEPIINSFLEESNRNKILSAQEKYLDLVQGLIALDAARNLKNTNYQIYMQLALMYFENNKSTIFRKILMETIFKYLQPRSEYLEGYDFFSKICRQLNTEIFFVEMAYALFFAYQLKKFEDIKNILNFYFLRFDLNDYDYIKYYCMYYFYQGQYYLLNKVFKIIK